MQTANIIHELERNRTIFENLLRNTDENIYYWRPAPEKWNLLEILCHLVDEEKEDFRFRTRHVLLTPRDPMPPIDPAGWVESRSYAKQDYHQKLEEFLAERQKSIEWLKSLDNPNWKNTFEHSFLGPMSAGLFLHNWLAHDYFHIRQINKNRFTYLQQLSEHDLTYAGNW
ncbi:MAG: DinB family protein [Bacteroidetes bacterium]|nr:DinB family protein [Bacteroidota bacterium]